MMKELNILFILFLLAGFLVSHRVEAKRRPPKKIEPVVYDHIKYTAPVFSESTNHKQLSGYIEAWDTRADKKLWELKVYDIKYDPGLDKSAQEIYITSLKAEFGNLIVTNELDDEYEVELATKKVTKKLGHRAQSSSKQVSKNSILVK